MRLISSKREQPLYPAPGRARLRAAEQPDVALEDALPHNGPRRRATSYGPDRWLAKTLALLFAVQLSSVVMPPIALESLSASA